MSSHDAIETEQIFQKIRQHTPEEIWDAVHADQPVVPTVDHHRRDIARSRGKGPGHKHTPFHPIVILPAIIIVILVILMAGFVVSVAFSPNAQHTRLYSKSTASTAAERGFVELDAVHPPAPDISLQSIGLTAPASAAHDQAMTLEVTGVWASDRVPSTFTANVHDQSTYSVTRSAHGASSIYFDIPANSLSVGAYTWTARVTWKNRLFSATGQTTVT